MRTIELNLTISEDGGFNKEVSVSVRPSGDNKVLCQPMVKIRDAKSGFETIVKLPENEYCSIRSCLEDIADCKLDGAFVLGLFQKLGSLFETRRTG